MKNKTIYLFFLLTFIGIACTKVTDNSGSVTDGTGKAYLNVTEIDSAATINNIITPSNGVVFTTAGVIHGGGYYLLPNGQTNVKVQFSQTGQLFYDTTFGLSAGSLHSVYIYPVSKIYRASVTTDDFSAVTGNTAYVRILDFADSVINQSTNFSFSDGKVLFTSKNRHFLDHETNNTFAKFVSVPAGNYTLYATIGNTVLVNPYPFNLVNGKIYSIVITGITSSDLYDFVMNHN
jgi:hypothetical protein